MRTYKKLIIIFVLFFLSTITQANNMFWQKQESNSKSRLRAVASINSRVAWASGTQGTFLRTTNGGKTWIASKVSGAEELDFRDLEAFDEKEAYLLSIGEGEKSRIYKTINGGETWQLSYQNTKAKAFFDGIAFWDKENGIAFSDPVEGRFLIITTKDGGKTWQETPKENIPPAIMGEAAFAASGTSITVEGKNNVWIATGGLRARVFRSNDRGKTWVVAETPIISGNDSTGIFSLAFKDSKNGVIVGGDYKKPEEKTSNAAITKDGGKTWQLVKNPPSGYRSCVFYLNEPKQRALIAVGINGSDYSLDNGETWQSISLEGFHSLNLTSQVGWAVGEEGKIAKIENPLKMLEKLHKNNK
ncbi:MAG: oxidoreductase [Acidobacteria bacterium]|nr:oxidoreductase [Acidobacteriota bacterium]